MHPPDRVAWAARSKADGMACALCFRPVGPPAASLLLQAQQCTRVDLLNRSFPVPSLPPVRSPTRCRPPVRWRCLGRVSLATPNSMSSARQTVVQPELQRRGLWGRVSCRADRIRWRARWSVSSNTRWTVSWDVASCTAASSAARRRTTEAIDCCAWGRSRPPRTRCIASKRRRWRAPGRRSSCSPRRHAPCPSSSRAIRGACRRVAYVSQGSFFRSDTPSGGTSTVGWEVAENGRAVAGW